MAANYDDRPIANLLAIISIPSLCGKVQIIMGHFLMCEISQPLLEHPIDLDVFSN